MPDIIKTPSEPPRKYPTRSPGIYNGEPGLAKRTPSPNAQPEKTIESTQPNKGNRGIYPSKW